MWARFIIRGMPMRVCMCRLICVCMYTYARDYACMYACVYVCVCVGGGGVDGWGCTPSIRANTNTFHVKYVCV